jgi:ATP-dependent DNA ligase
VAFERKKPAAIGIKAPYPGFIPALATSVDKVPSGERWIHEIKFDGYLGRRKGNDLIYGGKVDHGFDPAAAKDLQLRMKPLIRKDQPYTKKIAHRGIWIEPSLLAEIEYRAKSAEGKVRHPFFKGIVHDPQHRRAPVDPGLDRFRRRDISAALSVRALRRGLFTRVLRSER